MSCPEESVLSQQHKEYNRMLARYVCQSLKQENVGLADEETVYQILINGADDEDQTLDYRDTVGFIEAYQYLRKLASDVLEIGLLENNIICEVHKILMGHRSHLCTVGRYSRKERMTEFEGKIHYYTRFCDIDQTMQLLIDEFNRRLDKIHRRSLRTTDWLEPFESLIHLTSWFIHKFLEIHPFGDGNGRMVRLLYTYIMEAFGIPFPTPILWYTKEEIQTKDGHKEYTTWCKLISNIRLTLDFKELELDMLRALGECCKECTRYSFCKHLLNPKNNKK